MKNLSRHIDWKNHIIAFLSALLGILIAFQLEDYRLKQNDLEQLEVAIKSVQKEIDHNLSVYQSNTYNLTLWLEYIALGDLVNESGNIVVSKVYYDSLKNNPGHRGRFDDWEISGYTGDSVIINISKSDFNIDIIPNTDISTSSWHSALSNGLLNRLDYNTLAQLTKIYQWIEKDFGFDELDIYSIPIDNAINETVYDNLTNILLYYKKIQAIHSWKYRMIQPIYEEIDW